MRRSIPAPETVRSGGEIRPLASGILALATAMGIGRFAYTAILPSMERTAHLDISHAGLLASMNYAGYLVGALLATVIPRGPLHRRLVIGCLVAIVATTAAMAQATGVFTWSVIRFTSGVASAGVFVLAGGIVLDFLRASGRTLRSGWIYSGVGMGIATSGLVVRLADRAVGWRGDWVVLAVVAALAVGVSWTWLPGSPGRQRPSRTPPGLNGPSMGRLTLLVLSLAYFLEGAGYIVTGTFLVAIVDRMPGLNDAGPSVWIAAGLAAIPSAILWVRLAGRLGYVPALALAYLVQAGGIVLPAIGSGLTIALLAAVSFGATFIGISALTMTLAGLLAPDRSSAAIGLLTVIFGVGQIAGPVMGAYLAGSSHHFGLALSVAAGMVMLGGVLMLWLQNMPGLPTIAAITRPARTNR